MNGDGIQQDDEPGIPGVEISLNSSNVNLVETTDENGFYSFQGLHPGTYSLQFDAPNNYTLTTANAGSNEEDSDLMESGTIQLTFTEGGIRDSIDAGYFLPGSIGDFVWEDLNNNGLQDEDEPGIPGANLSLYNTDDELIASLISDTTGWYLFTNLSPGAYYIEVEIDSRYLSTEFQIGSPGSADLDSDILLQDGAFQNRRDYHIVKFNDYKY